MNKKLIDHMKRKRRTKKYIERCRAIRRDKQDIMNAKSADAKEMSFGRAG